ncbi:MAG: alkylmercury lyase [Bacteroidetes bacterium]|nr:alkylmercury lyase [Bacteroidota bacterium]
MEMVLIEFQYFNGCPNADSTLHNLREVMAEQGILETHLKMTEVTNIESAKALKFQGSPSILLDGRDIYTGDEPTDFSYACRLYRFGGEQTGVIPKEFIKAKLEQWINHSI